MRPDRDSGRQPLPRHTVGDSGLPDTGLSVVIPVRNAADTLGMQLDALVAAEKPSGGFEVIVSDNGSSDETAAIARTFEPRLTIHVIDASGAPGSNYARNQGVRAARYQRILLCDGDDQIDPRWLLAMSAAFDEGHRFVAGPIDYRQLNEAGARAWRGAERASIGVVLGFLPSGHGANLGFTRGVWEALTGFDESFGFGGEDVEFCWRAQLAGIPLSTVPDAVVNYRLRPTLSALFTQSRAYGVGEARLYQAFAPLGLSRRPPRAPLSDLWWTITRLPFAATTGRRGAWLRRLGQQVGRIEGSVRFRVLWW